MADELVSALLRAEDLRVVLALTSDLSRRARELGAVCADSEQLRTEVMLGAVSDGEEPLAVVGGLLLQPLPRGDLDALTEHGTRLEVPGTFQGALRAGGRSGAAAAVKAL